ncbi:hypothetical protein QYF61_016430 [Mycteria americana]|uniref:Uncharacterized protein n=1 Tax=Mycteria americana TaxID=33587 RepID=A0AAN7S018_MYCAM|nr:hypothetical protein QYF61_016430 [Mycteria americana]
MYPNSPKLPGLGSGLAELRQLAKRISPASQLRAGSPRTRQCKRSAAVARLRGLQLAAGSAQPVRRAGKATMPEQVSADPRLKEKLALSPPTNSGSFFPSTAGSPESQNCIGWKRPLRSSSPTINLTLPRPPLYHVPKHLIQTSFKYLQGWRLNHFAGQPVPMLDNPLGEEFFPNIQSKPPLVQLEAISSCPITCYLGEETDPHLSTTSFQVVVESKKVSPQPPFLQAEQPQFPQPLLRRLVLQTLHQLRCPSLHTLQHLNVFLVVGGPKLNTVFEVRPHQCRPAVNQHPQVLFRWAAFQPLFPKPVALHGVAVAQVQDPALGLVEPHTIDLGPSTQPVQLPLQSLPTLKQINTPTQLGVICKLTEGALDPFVQIIDKDIKQNWPQHRALGNTACERPPTGLNSIHHHSLGPAIQPVLYPAKSTPVQAMSSQFLQENALTLETHKPPGKLQEAFPTQREESGLQRPPCAEAAPKSSSAEDVQKWLQLPPLPFQEASPEESWPATTQIQEQSNPVQWNSPDKPVQIKVLMKPTKIYVYTHTLTHTRMQQTPYKTRSGTELHLKGLYGLPRVADCVGADGLSTLGDSRWKEPNEKGNADRDAMEERRGGDSLVVDVTTGSTGPTLPFGGTLSEEVSACGAAIRHFQMIDSHLQNLCFFQLG